MKKQTLYIIIGVIVILLIVAGAIFFIKKGVVPGGEEGGNKVVIKEDLVIPSTEEINTVSGKDVSSGDVEVALNPGENGDKIVVEKAVLTVKGVFDLTSSVSKNWSSDALLSFVKSAGAVDLDGKSSQWQAVYVSKIKADKGYEIIVQGDKIVSKKELPSQGVGAELPASWFDSGEAIKRIQDLPQFSQATMSSISFFYNPDAEAWRYGIGTSLGATSIEVE